ncbi:Uncharacterised protein [Mycobacteroides abscessus subsp. abscessus]|nr:Uncharacterised protein [Mycobacteroides abscessus subsp. abscessus]
MITSRPPEWIRISLAHRLFAFELNVSVAFFAISTSLNSTITSGIRVTWTANRWVNEWVIFACRLSAVSGTPSASPTARERFVCIAGRISR